jgi:hypothetical protein
METRIKAKRQRGGQPGNLNALKHGFYSKTFKKIETEDLESMGGEGLEDEIEMMRIITRRFLELAQKAKTMKETATVLNTLGMASVRLASLLRVQNLLKGDMKAKVMDDLEEALREVAKELGISQ